MFKKLDARTARALHVWQNQPGFSDIEKFLTDELSLIYDHLVATRDPAIVGQLQGRALAIREFLNLVRDAPKVLEKLGTSSL